MTPLILAGLIALVAAIIVALPFLREPQTDNDEIGGRTPESDRLLELMEARDRSLAALKELEFDHRTGKVDDVDYRSMVGPLRRAAAESLQELDRMRDAATSRNGDSA